MRKILLSELAPGTSAAATCYSQHGSAVVSGGEMITQARLDELQELGLTAVYESDDPEDVEFLLRQQGVVILSLAELAPGSSYPFPLYGSDGSKIFEEAERVTADQVAVLRRFAVDTLFGYERDVEGQAEPRAPEVRELMARLDPPIVAAIAAEEFPEPIRRFGGAMVDMDAHRRGRLAHVQSLYLETVHALGTHYAALRDGAAPPPFRRFHAVAANLFELLVSDWSLALTALDVKHGSRFLEGHAANVALLSMAIAGSLGYDGATAIRVGAGALLADVGMLKVPTRIREKRGTLSSREMRQIRKHLFHGMSILQEMEGVPEEVVRIVYQAHEREKGQGYPTGRSGIWVHEHAKILAVADVYESLVCRRPFRDRRLPHEAMTLVLKLAATQVLASRVVTALLDTLSLYPIGSCVELSGGEIGQVVGATPGRGEQPIVAVLYDNNGYPLEAPRVVDLGQDPARQILRPVDEFDIGVGLSGD
ncbi:MAG: HD domain-containing protein [Candidatus Schekmanbacteria bacterium]|nr:HD domain-containing protein [Candidatus Schekmanbacteria bacterium]